MGLGLLTLGGSGSSGCSMGLVRWKSGSYLHTLMR